MFWYTTGVLNILVHFIFSRGAFMQQNWMIFYWYSFFFVFGKPVQFLLNKAEYVLSAKLVQLFFGLNFSSTELDIFFYWSSWYTLNISYRQSWYNFFCFSEPCSILNWSNWTFFYRSSWYGFFIYAKPALFLINRFLWYKFYEMNKDGGL